MHLIKKGAEVNVTTIDYWSPLLKATYKQYHEILSRLIEKGANLGQRLPNSNTALHIATENGDLNSVKILVEAGFKDIDCLNKEKETPLMIAEKHMNRGE